MLLEVRLTCVRVKPTPVNRRASSAVNYTHMGRGTSAEQILNFGLRSLSMLCGSTHGRREQRREQSVPNPRATSTKTLNPEVKRAFLKLVRMFTPPRACPHLHGRRWCRHARGFCAVRKRGLQSGR
eukprot:358495-Chlamydomonas_euryale.AAC.10